MLAAQLLGLALGTADAEATGAGPTTRRTLEPAAPAGVGGLLTLDGAVGEIGSVLRQHLGTAELPLPGQHSAGPDAFAIAARLLSAAPQQSRPEDADRASRSHPAEGHPGEPAPRAPAARSPEDPAPLPSRRHVDNLTAPTPVRLPPPPAAPGNGAPVTLTASPAAPDDGDSTAAVLLPIAAGLLLTAAATYKHRGLPGGH